MKHIVHIAEVEVSPDTGMGRVAWHWKNAVEECGYEFVHVGPDQVGKMRHKCLFPSVAHETVKRLGIKPVLYLVHEPASGAFVSDKIPTVVFSHGLERRGWELRMKGKIGVSEKLSLRTRMLYPLWRLRPCDIGLQKADKLFLINSEDAEFAQEHYGRKASQICIFKNGVSPLSIDEKQQPVSDFKVLFLGQWVERKGIRTIVDAAKALHEKGFRLKWLLAGTSMAKETILKAWPEELHTSVTVISRFLPSDEASIFAQANLFVLPSFFEGQPLALLQGMEAGRCCITTNCCGQRDIIQDGFNGLLHEPGDSQRLAELIAMCANDLALRLTLGANAKHFVSDRSWDNVSREVAGHIEQVLAR